MALTYDDRFPFLDSAGRKRLLERAMACAGPIAERLKVPEAAVRNARLLGCGNYGCTLLIEGLPRDKAVLKITSDNMEANAALQIVDDYTAPQEDGLLKIEQVFQLGKCSVLPGMRPFSYTKQAMSGSYYGQATKSSVHYRGPGAPYRPLWVIQREELDDAWPRLQAMKRKKKDVDDALHVIWSYASNLAEDQVTHKRGSRHRMPGPTHERLDAALAVVEGSALLGALEWLIERDMSWLDMRKVVNLGWRPGTGLVIRDIGFTEASRNVLDEVESVGGARGQTRRARRGGR